MAALSLVLLWAIGPALAAATGLALRGTADLSLAALALLAAATAAAAALGQRLSIRPSPDTAIAVGAATTALLMLAADRSVLRWTLVAVPGAELPGVGLVLGVMLLAVLAGTLSLLADRLCPGASRYASVFGRRALLLAAGLGAIAAGFLVKEGLAADDREWATLAGVTAAVAWLASALWTSALSLLADAASLDSPAVETRARRIERLAALLTTAGLLAAGYDGWSARGGYLAGVTPHALTATLVAIAVLQPTRFSIARTLALVLALAGTLAFWR
jgi:hypothetical protein